MTFGTFSLDSGSQVKEILVCGSKGNQFGIGSACLMKQVKTVYESTSYIPVWKKMAESCVAFQQSFLQSLKSVEICINHNRHEGQKRCYWRNQIWALV